MINILTKYHICAGLLNQFDQINDQNCIGGIKRIFWAVFFFNDIIKLSEISLRLSTGKRFSQIHFLFFEVYFNQCSEERYKYQINDYQRNDL